MITSRNLFILAAILIGVFLITTMMGKCSRRKPVTKHETNRQTIMKSNSAESRRDTLERAAWNSQKKALLATIEDLKKRNSALAKKDVQLESRYRKAPAVVGCDSVIDSKNSRISTLESINAKLDQAGQVNDSLLASYAGSIRAKDETIDALNAGYAKAIQDLQQALKPKRWGLGITAGYGVGPSLRPAPVVSVGLSYNLIRF